MQSLFSVHSTFIAFPTPAVSFASFYSISSKLEKQL